MPRQRFLFNSVQDAQSFLIDVNDEAHRSNALALSSFSRSSIEGIVRKNHGTRSPTSSHRKELFVYNYQDFIFNDDYLYLHTRDPTVQGITRRVPRDTWFRLPETMDPSIDEYFSNLTRRNFPQKAIEADVSQRRDGSSFLYIVASGSSPDQPLEREDEIFGFQVIPFGRIDPQTVIPDTTGNPLLAQHGIAELTIDGDPSIAKEEGEVTKPIDSTFTNLGDTTIHGSRLLLFKEDQETDFWIGRPKIEPIYDDIWNLRDIVWAQTTAQFEGDPIAVEISDDAKFGLTPDSEEMIQEEIEEYVTGLGQVFSPVEGVRVKRVGQQNLIDPTPILRAIVSRISTATEMPVGMLMAMSRGSEQVTDQDILTYASEIDIRRQSFCLPILQHMVFLGKWTRSLPDSAQLPLDLYWPNLRTLSPREKAYVHNTSSMAMDRALQWGRKLPREIERMFPNDPGAVRAEPQDPSPPNSEDQRLQRIESMLFDLLNKLEESDNR